MQHVISLAGTDARAYILSTAQDRAEISKDSTKEQGNIRQIKLNLVGEDATIIDDWGVNPDRRLVFGLSHQEHDEMRRPRILAALARASLC